MVSPGPNDELLTLKSSACSLWRGDHQGGQGRDRSKKVSKARVAGTGSERAGKLTFTGVGHCAGVHTGLLLPASLPRGRCWHKH